MLHVLRFTLHRFQVRVVQEKRPQNRASEGVSCFDQRELPPQVHRHNHVGEVRVPDGPDDARARRRGRI